MINRLKEGLNRVNDEYTSIADKWKTLEYRIDSRVSHSSDGSELLRALDDARYLQKFYTISHAVSGGLIVLLSMSTRLLLKDAGVVDDPIALLPLIPGVLGSGLLGILGNYRARKEGIDIMSNALASAQTRTT